MSYPTRAVFARLIFLTRNALIAFVLIVILNAANLRGLSLPVELWFIYEVAKLCIRALRSTLAWMRGESRDARMERYRKREEARAQRWHDGKQEREEREEQRQEDLYRDRSFRFHEDQRLRVEAEQQRYRDDEERRRRDDDEQRRRNNDGW